jgi:surface-anchored protein
VWQTDEFGDPTVWVATAGNQNPDLFFTAPGGHIDYNWAFTAPGNYDMDIVASAFLPDFTPVYSDVTRYHFQVDDTPGSLPQGAGDLSSQFAGVSQALVAGTYGNVGMQTTVATFSGNQSSLASLPLETTQVSGSPQAAPADQFFSSSAASNSMGQTQTGAATSSGDLLELRGSGADFAHFTP